MFVNPWASYKEEEIPTVYTGDYKEDAKVIWAFLYWILISVVFFGGVMAICEFVIGFGSENFPVKFATVFFSVLGIYIFSIVFGIKRILK